MTDETPTNTDTQGLEKNLDFLHNVIERKEHGEDFYSDAFIQISDGIVDALNRQASDEALTLLAHGAIQLWVSDVHLEIHETNSSLLYRIDGELSRVCDFTHKQHQQLAQRCKYRSNLKLNITNVPQDGKFRLGEKNRDAKVDVRVSTLPTRYGESIVCRVLDSGDTILDFEQLGIMGKNKERLERAMSKKQWMILVTGPTGSGKTTTLYTLLIDLNTSKNKIITLEDPIEYQIPDVLQSEINERDGYTFASGVRSILRHDPDIIMIGEIRDLETGDTAIQSSLTGHLVLSTLHTKSSFETLERLLNMGIARYDISSALDIIIAQRLARRLCTKCCVDADQSEIISDPRMSAFIERFGSEKIQQFTESIQYKKRGKGCSRCGHTGYHGRIGLFEVLEMDDHLSERIREWASSLSLREEAEEKWFYTLEEDGLLKVLQGILDIHELYRVIGW